MTRARWAFLWALLLLALFVGGGNWMRRRYLAASASHAGGSPSAYVGDWQARAVNLDLHIEAQGQTLRVTGLEAEPVIFERTSEQQPFQQSGGGRRLYLHWKGLELEQPDGQRLDLRPREAR